MHTAGKPDNRILNDLDAAIPLAAHSNRPAIASVLIRARAEIDRAWRAESACSQDSKTPAEPVSCPDFGRTGVR